MQRIARSAAVVFLACWACVAAETPDGGAKQSTPEQLAQWVKDLDSEDFGTRQDAEVNLKRAGAAAIPYVEKAMKAGSAETLARGRIVLDEIGWEVREDLKEPSACLPEGTVLTLYSAGLAKGVQRLRAETPAGKIYDDPAFAPVKEAFAQWYIQARNPTEKQRENIATLFQRFGGPAGIALTGFQERRERFVSILGITDPDRAKTYNEYNEQSPITHGEGQITQTRHRGIAINQATGGWSRYARALVKNVILESMRDPEDLKAVIDLVAGTQAKPLSGNPAFVETFKRFAPEPLGRFYFDYPRLAADGGLGPGDAAFAKAMGVESLKALGVALNVQDGLTLEQGFAKIDGERVGLLKMLDFKAPTAAHTALCPPDALVYLAASANGKVLYEEILRMAEGADPRDAKFMTEFVESIDAKTGLKFVDGLLAGMDGEMAFWLTRPAGPNPIAPPDFYAALAAKDAEAAKAFSDGIAKILGGDPNANELTGSAEYKGRSVHWVNQAAIGRVSPYGFAWCAEGARVLVAGSQESLQRLLARVDGKAAGLDASEDFKALLAKIPEAERGALCYANVPAFVSWLYLLAGPVMAEDAGEDLKASLAAMPKDLAPLLKGVTGTLLSFRGTPDGLVARATGSVPASGLFVGGIAGSEFYWRSKYRREAKARAVEEQKRAAEQGE